MEKLTNIIEATLFAAGNAVPVKLLAEKLGVSEHRVEKSVEELKDRYVGDSGIYILSFNGKVQLATNPNYKDEVALVLNSIKEKELTKTILECAAIVAYKQPITRGELEDIRRVNSDYAVRTLVELGIIAPCGRKDAPGHPMQYATTDKFLKRFNISELGELPNYSDLLDQIAKLSEEAAESDSSYLYQKDEYTGEDEEEIAPSDITEEE
ncbi:MAG: SMC-Scp complex subunit ScpB [Clostridia bacterium]|nr:SMC-Scp complex subunit ScpB [Clostridia bacterium]